MDENIRARVNISGRVQGVCFRMETKKKADYCKVTGWVKNRPDGTVEAVFEGKRHLVEEIVAWCRKGPPGSKVEKLDIEIQPYGGQWNGFDIIF